VADVANTWDFFRGCNDFTVVTLAIWPPDLLLGGGEVHFQSDAFLSGNPTHTYLLVLKAIRRVV